MNKVSFYVLVLSLLSFCNVVLASSHSEAPQTAVAPGADITDLYAFRSYESGQEDTITFIMNSSPLQEPFAGPNWYGFSNAHFYQFVIHENSCAAEDHVFSFYFGSKFGGTFGTVPVFEPNFCNNTNPELLDPGYEGLTIDVLNAAGTVEMAQHIPLKFLGSQSSSGNFASNILNSHEYFTLDYATSLGTFPRNKVAANLSIPLPNVGSKTFSQGYQSYLDANSGFVHTVSDSSFCSGTPFRVFAGQRAESFAVNLGNIFDLINLNPIPGSADSVVDSDSNNPLLGKNVQTIAMEIPTSCFSGATGSTIGVWASTRHLYHDNVDNHREGVQFSRLGNPLVNEVVIGLKDKNKFNAQHPVQDGDFATYVTNPSLPAIINALFNSDPSSNIAPNAPRNDLPLVFLTGIPSLNNNPVGCEMLRLNFSYNSLPADQQGNMGVLDLDVAGFPNGRRPGDDVVDIALRTVMGRVCSACATFSTALNLGDRFVCDNVCDENDAPVGNVDFLDGAPQNAGQFQIVFPYLQNPYSGNTDNVVQGSSSSSSASSILESTLF